MKSFASTQLFILTDIAKTAIIDHLTQRLESIGRLQNKAITADLASAAVAERNEILAQLDYYSGGPIVAKGPLHSQSNGPAVDLKPQWVRDAEARSLRGSHA